MGDASDVPELQEDQAASAEGRLARDDLCVRIDAAHRVGTQIIQMDAKGRRREGRCEVFPVFGEAAIAADHEKVRSTTQRRGKRTKPFMSSLRLSISIRNDG